MPVTLQPADGDTLRVVCLGAHSDDIEIGSAGTLLRWLSEYPKLHVTWAVACAAGERGEEARRSAGALMNASEVTSKVTLDLMLGELADAWMPADYARAKSFVNAVRDRAGAVDVVLTHRLEDRHQDHRMLAELSWQAWRSHLLMAYEIPKYEADLGQPNTYVPLPDGVAQRKVAHLMQHFGSQRGKDWFRESTFNALMALRGIECRAPSGMAEAFTVLKVVW